jgi:hypothetical protein
MPADLRQYRGVLVRLPDHPATRIAELLPWNGKREREQQLAA